MMTIPRRARLVALGLLIGAGGAVHASLPSFEDCKVQDSAAVVSAAVHLSSSQQKKYAAQLRQAAARPANFSGPHVMATWGCGAGCVMGAAISKKDGRVVMLPFTLSNWPLDVLEPLSFRKDSCLLIAQGSRDEKGQGRYFYRFDGKAFVLLDSVER